MKTFISVLIEPTRAFSLMGSTIPDVPRIDMPPTMPRRGLNVRAPMVSPSGTDTTMSAPSVYPSVAKTSLTHSVIMLRGTRLMAALPGGWSRPLRVTLPTPKPPSMRMPASWERTTFEKMSAPLVSSMSSPPSLRTAQEAHPSPTSLSSTFTWMGIPRGVTRSTYSGTSFPRAPNAAAFDAAAAQEPVV